MNFHMDVLDARSVVRLNVPTHAPSTPIRLASIAHEPYFSWLEIIIARSRPRDGAYKKGGKCARFKPHRAPTVAEIKGHFGGGPKKVGTFLMRIGSSTTLLWVIDLDDHDGTLGWDELCRRADAVTAQLAAKGLCPARFRSSGGKGSHLWGYWDEEQDSYSARQLLKQCVLAAGLEVKAGVAEVFPAQDRIEQGACGTCVFWPIERLDNGEWQPSAPVPRLEPSERPMASAHTGDTDLQLLRSAVMAIPNGGDGGDEQPFGDGGEFGWLKVGMALHNATRGGDEGMELWHEWSEQSGSKYDPRDLERRWRSFKPGGGVTAGTIFFRAEEHGWDRRRAEAENAFSGAGGGQYENDAGAAESLEAAVERLAKLHPLQYDRVRKTEAQRLGLRVTTLDAAVAAARKRMGLDDGDEPDKQGKRVEFVEVEPWPSRVDGAQLLDDLAAAYAMVMMLPPYAAEALALWTVFTYLLDSADIAPLLVLASPVKRCGKTRLIEVLTRLVHRPLPTNNITAAAMYRVIATACPCVLLDELDALLESDKTGEIRGLLNAGHSRATAYVIRTVGEDFEPRAFTVWCPKVLALIGNLEKQWGTVADRAVVLSLQRKPASSKLPGLKKAGIDFHRHRRGIARWAADNAETVRVSDPSMPDGLNDRASDNWRILIAIADSAGGAWPEKAREAALGLSGDNDTVTVNDGAGVRLLADIRGIFSAANRDRIATEELIQKLTAIDDPEAPWAEWNSRAGWGERHIKPRQIAKLLKPFGIKPGTVRLPDGATPKGYMREKFEAAFASYLSPEFPPSPGNW